MKSISVSAKVPAAAWQTGTLKDLTTETLSRTIGLNGMLAQKHYLVCHYLIESADYVYEATRTIHSDEKQLEVTVNGPIKFALIGTDFYVQDEKGKEHKLDFVKKTLKTPSQSGQQR